MVRDTRALPGVLMVCWDLKIEYTVWTVLGNPGLWLGDFYYGVCAQGFLFVINKPCKISRFLESYFGLLLGSSEVETEAGTPVMPWSAAGRHPRNGPPYDRAFISTT